MRKLGILLIIVLTLIVATPNISFARRLVGSGHVGVSHSRSLVVRHRTFRNGHRPVIVRHHPVVIRRGPVLVRRGPVFRSRPFFYSSFGYSPFFFDPVVGLNFGFVIR
jgi:hypothetical protein